MPRAACGDAGGLTTHGAAQITGTGQATYSNRLHQAQLRVQAAIAGQAPVTTGG